MPQWVTTGVRPRYPSDLYITGVGSAEIKYNDTAAAQAQADARALAQVAKQIEVVIQQRSSSLEREVGSSSGGTLNQRDVWEKTAAFVKSGSRASASRTAITMLTKTESTPLHPWTA